MYLFICLLFSFILSAAEVNSKSVPGNKVCCFITCQQKDTSTFQMTRMIGVKAGEKLSSGK